ncbi:Alpha/Beta hydrolase protein, partial [Xylogone sp. PMI_703]
SRGFTYYYLHLPPRSFSQSTKYILFLHGWPSIAQEWHNQIEHFHSLGYGVLAPDLLGSGRSSRPTDIKKYGLKDMASDIIEVLKHEKISKVYGVGHDWGSHLLGRLAVYHQEMIEKLCFIAVGYCPPGQPINLDTVNEITLQKLGYEIFGYQVFFTRNRNAEKILNDHKDSMMSLIYPADPGLWKTDLAPLGALENWLKNDRQADWADFLTEAANNTTNDLGGIPNLNWYKANALNYNYEAEKDLDSEKKFLPQSTLFLSCSKDLIALPHLQISAMEEWVPKLRTEEMNTAHWAMLEAPQRVNEALEKFFN